MRKVICSFLATVLATGLAFGGSNSPRVDRTETTVTTTKPDGSRSAFTSPKDTFVLRDGTVFITFHADVDFTARERLVIDDVAQTWFIQTGGMILLKMVYDLDFRSTMNLAVHKSLSHSLLVRRDSDNPLVDESGVLGTTMPSGGIYLTGQVIVSVMTHHIPSERVMWSTLLHEFGHTVGMQHTEDPFAVMHPSINPRNVGRCLTRPDIAELCRVNDCDGWKMKACK